MKNNIRSNFDMLRPYEEQLWRLGALAERYFADDPNTSILKLRQLAELLGQSLAARAGLYTSQEESQYELIRRLQGEGILPRDVKQMLDQVRVVGNAANLDISWLKDDSAESAQSQLDEPATLAMRELNAALADLRALVEELGEDPDLPLEELLGDVLGEVSSTEQAA